MSRVRVSIAVALVLAVVPVVAARADPITVRMSPESIFQGGVAVAILEGEEGERLDASRLQGEFQERPIGFFAGRDGRARALIGVDLSTEPGLHELAITVTPAPGSDAPARTLATAVRVVHKEYPSERLTVASKYVDFDDETLARITRERAQVDKALLRFTPMPGWHGPFRLPAKGALGSPFGLRRFFNGEPRNPHGGQDLRVPKGTPVRAVQAGTVILAADHYFAGKSVYLDHGLGLLTAYFHLNEILVTPGTTVAPGDVIARSGKSGRVTGAHLHWAAYLNRARIDPMLLLTDPVAEQMEDTHDDDH